MSDKINQLMEIVEAEIKGELEILRVVVTNIREVLSENCAAEISHKLSEASENLDRYVDKLRKRYAPFKTRADAFTYLKDKGFQVARGKFYNDCLNKEDGAPALLRLQEDKSILKRDLDLYAKILPPPIDSEMKIKTALFKKAKYAAEREETQAELDRIKLQKEKKELIPRFDSERNSAGNFQMYEQNVKNTHLMEAPAWIELVHGDINMVPELIEAMNRKFDEISNRMAGMKQFKIAFEWEDGE